MKARKFVNEHKRRGEIESYLYGPHVIESWLAESSRRLDRIWVRGKPHGRLARVAQMARDKCVDVQETSDDELRRISGTGHHQGVVGLARDFQYAPLDRVVATRPSLLLALDQVQDPRNLGAILRTAAAVATGGIILPKHGTVGITPTVEVAAAGAAARVPIVRVTNLVRTVGLLRQAGYWAIALEASAKLSIFEVHAPGPTVLVVGGEAGVRPLLLRNCDEAASIPMPGGVESLNVSVAAGVALYEAHRRASARLDSP